jgi:AhpD family alkylhydroperoxidase
MDIKAFNEERNSLNKLMTQTDDFFGQFGSSDDSVYSEGAIPKKYKEITGLSISVLTRCEECIRYHIQWCISEKAGKEEIIEAIKIGVIGGGSITYPSARIAFNILKQLKVL